MIGPLTLVKSVRSPICQLKKPVGTKLIIRMTDADDLSDQAKKFMNKRLMPHNNDGDIWVLQSSTAIEIAALKSLGFEFFARNDPPHEERSWAIRREVKFLDGQEPKDMILWMSDDPTSHEFEGRKFVLLNKQEPETNSVLLPTYTPASSEVVTQTFIEHCLPSLQYGTMTVIMAFYHWMRVLQNGRQLAKAEGANIKVVELFLLVTWTLSGEMRTMIQSMDLGLHSSHKHLEASGLMLQMPRWNF